MWINIYQASGLCEQTELAASVQQWNSELNENFNKIDSHINQVNL